MLLMIDNYDSFTYNLVQYFGELGHEMSVLRNDQVTLAEIEQLRPAAIVISPGPGNPGDAGISRAAIERFAPELPILGVCLGHQCIGETFGSRIVRAATIMHGKTSAIEHDGTLLFAGIPNPCAATRYHSLTIDPESLGPDLVVTARADTGEIMGVRHVRYQTFGIQFHPESVLTDCGHMMLANFLRIAGLPVTGPWA